MREPSRTRSAVGRTVPRRRSIVRTRRRASTGSGPSPRPGWRRRSSPAVAIRSSSSSRRKVIAIAGATTGSTIPTSSRRRRSSTRSRPSSGMPSMALTAVPIQPSRLVRSTRSTRTGPTSAVPTQSSSVDTSSVQARTTSTRSTSRASPAAPTTRMVDSSSRIRLPMERASRSVTPQSVSSIPTPSWAAAPSPPIVGT